MPRQPVCLASIGTAVPESSFTCEEFCQLQTDAAEYAISKLDKNDKQQYERIEEIQSNLKWVIRMAKCSQIKQRYCFKPDEGTKLQDFYKAYDYNPPYTLRAKYWRRYCPEIALNAVKDALQSWGGDKNKITHVITHSVTGWDVPGLSHHIIYSLNLPVSTRAIPINFVGCHGGASVIYAAAQIAKSEPDAVILAIAAEIQSPFGRMYSNEPYDKNGQYMSLDRSIYIPNVLFGDAAACALICRPKDNNFKLNKFPLFEFSNKMGAHYIPNTRDCLTVSVTEDYGLYIDNIIKKELPNHLKNTLIKYFPKWFKNCFPNKEPKQVDYAVHPGGLKVLLNFNMFLKELGVENTEDVLKYAFKNFREYGNIASAAIFYILKDVCFTTKKDDIYFMAMGPGMCLEYGGLTRYNPKNEQNKENKQNNNKKNDNKNLIIVILLSVIIALIAVMFKDLLLN